MKPNDDLNCNNPQTNSLRFNYVENCLFVAVQDKNKFWKLSDDLKAKTTAYTISKT